MENKNKKANDIIIINFSTYAKPEIIETPYRQWVRYGKNNDYYQYLIDMFNSSVTNSAVINGIADMIFGEGLSAKDASSKVDEYASFISLFKDKEIKKLVTDFKLLGGGALQVIYNKKHDKIVELHHIPTETLRAERCDDDGNILGYFYAKDWTKTAGKGRPIRYPAFGTSREALEILFIQTYKPGSFYYTPVDYQAGLCWAEVETEISIYHISNIKCGFAPSTLINFNDGQASTQEEKQMVEEKVTKKFTGTSGNKLIISFNDSTESQTTIETISISDAAEQYAFLSKEAQTKILMSHRVTSPLLFGINTTTGFNSNAEELKDASIFMHSTIIKPFQNVLINHFNSILSFNKLSLDIFFIPIQPWDVKEDEKLEEEELSDENQK